MYLTISAVLIVDTLVLEVYNHLPLLVNILAWRAINIHTCKVSSEVVSSQSTRIVKLFVQIHVPEFCHTMHVTKTMIMGSCVWQMLSEDNSCITNLNIIIINRGFDSFCTLIKDTLLYEWVDRTAKPHYTFDSFAQQFVTFKF